MCLCVGVVSVDVCERGRELMVPMVWHHVSCVRCLYVFKHTCVLCVGVHKWVCLREGERELWCGIMSVVCLCCLCLFKHACVLCVGVREWVWLTEREKER